MISKQTLLDTLDVFREMIMDECSDDTFTGAGMSTGGASGLVPAPAAGDNDKFLRGDGTWATFSLGSTSSTVEGSLWLEDEQ